MTGRTYLLLALLTAVSSILAQEGGEGGSQVAFRVTRFDPQDRPPPEFTVGGGKGRIDIKIPLTYIDGPFKATLRDDRFLDFWRGGGDKPEISISIAAGERKDLLLVFVPDKETFRILKISASEKKLKGGDRFILNTTGSDIAIKLGEAKALQIAPMKTGILPGPGGAKLKTLPVLIKQKSAEGWRLVSTEFWNCDPRFRKYLFIYTSPRTRKIAFHGVSERL